MSEVNLNCRVDNLGLEEFQEKLIAQISVADIRDIERRHRRFIRSKLQEQRENLNRSTLIDYALPKNPETLQDVKDTLLEPDASVDPFAESGIEEELNVLQNPQESVLTQDQRHKAHLQKILPSYRLVVVIFALTGMLLPFCVDMYLSSFPLMAAELQTDIVNIELTLSVFFFGIALGQLLWGPLSDSIGRKLITVIAIASVIITSLAIGIISSISELGQSRLVLILIMRFVQGIFCASILVTSVSMLRDIYETREFVKVNSTVTLIFFMAPFFAPLFGTYVSQIFSWHYIFFSIAAISLVSGILFTYYIPETINPEFKRKLQFKATFRTMGKILADGPSLWLILLMSSLSCVVFSYVSMSSNVYQTYYGISQNIFPYLFMLNIIGQYIFNIFNIKMVKYLEPRTLLLIGVVWFTIAGIVNIFLALNGMGFWAIVFGCMASMSGNSLCFTNAIAIMLEKHYRNSGTASCLVNVSRWIIPGVVTALVTGFNPHHGHTMLFCIGLFSLGVSLCYLFFRYFEYRHKNRLAILRKKVRRRAKA